MAFFVYSQVAYTIFLHAVRSLFENATFCLGYAEKHYTVLGKKERMLKITGKLLPEAMPKKIFFLIPQAKVAHSLPAVLTKVPLFASGANLPAVLSILYISSHVA